MAPTRPPSNLGLPPDLNLSHTGHNVPPPKTAGKHPALRPAASTIPTLATPLQPSKSNKAAARLKKQSTARPTHRMITRSKCKTFRLMELPPELRNNIYSHLFSNAASESINLRGIKLPPLLYVSSEVRTEALPIFCAESTFSAMSRSNWCVRNKHYHGPPYIRYEVTGSVRMSPLVNPDNSSSLSQEAIRIRSVDFRVNCVCCFPGVKIGTLHLQVAGKTPIVRMTVKTPQQEAQMALSEMDDSVNELVENISKRDHFNGFTMTDIVQVARCFRVEGRNHVLAS